MTRVSKRSWLMILALLAAVLVVSGFGVAMPEAYAAGAFVITRADGTPLPEVPDYYTFSGGVHTIRTTLPITITMDPTAVSPTTDRIVIDLLLPSTTANITLNGVNIDLSSGSGSAFEILSPFAVNLTLVGNNTLKSGGTSAGLQVPTGATLTIMAASTGSLEATGGNGGGAGIGGASGGAGGTVTINGGTVTATSTFGYSAGIGSGHNSNISVPLSGGTLTMTGGTLTATTSSAIGSAINATIDPVSGLPSAYIYKTNISYTDPGAWQGIYPGTAYSVNTNHHFVKIQSGSGFEPSFSGAANVNNLNVTAGTVITQQFTATGAAPMAYSLTGSVPTGVSINASTGLMTITGTVTAGTYNFGITASNGLTPATLAFTLTVNTVSSVQPAFTSANNTTVTAGRNSMFQVRASGTAPIAFSLTGQPTGVTINASTGLISIARTLSAGTYTFIITAANSAGTLSQSFRLTVRRASALPRTGDGFPLWPLLGLCIVSLAGAGWFALRKREQRKRG